MRIILNILWFIFGGFISFLEMVAVGMFCCVTLIGIPWGLQCFKIAGLAACPFGKEVEYEVGFAGTLGNIIWILLFGWETALTNLVLGLILCITIVGIPFGKQFFKLAAVTFFPFGAKISVEHVL